MRERTAAMNAADVPKAIHITRLDYAFLRRVLLVVGIMLVVVSPLSKDPLALAVGGLFPWILMRLVGTPTMPVAVVYLVLWQWAQTYARVLQTLADGEALGGGIFGPNVERAYWYMLASVFMLALALRLVLGSIPPPTQESRMAHTLWRTEDLVIVYVGTLLLSVAARYGSAMAAALEQPLQALLHLKSLVLFLIFTSVMMTGKGAKFALLVFLFEVLTGFTGILSDFKAVFIQLGLAALAVRIRWTATMGLMSLAWIAALVVLALFWTGVKAEYRQMATGSDESQEVTSSLSDRLGYLGTRALNPDKINWGESSYALLVRFAYVDIFGSVITVQEADPGRIFMRQWGDALSHILQPRFLFPDKPPLSDTEVYARLAKGDPTEEIRRGTSISVGYMAENFADLGFPGMLAGIFAIGLVTAAMYRNVMLRRLPWMVREGTVLVLVYSIGRDGVEISLPKLVGAIIMVMVVYLALLRFAYPPVLDWLNRPRAHAKAVAASSRT